MANELARAPSDTNSLSSGQSATNEAVTPARSWLDIGSLIWSSWFGAGYFPVASGTFGTLAGLPLAWALSFVGSWWVWSLVVIAFIAVSVPAAHRAGKIYGIVDARYIVSDEVAGLLLTVAFLPAFTWQVAVFAFFLFRILDILKPWPASYFDRKVKNGFGVTFDDVIAGLYARIGMEIFLRLGWLGIESPGWW